MLTHLILAAALQAAPAPRPAELRTFQDWVVGCDNGGACQAVAMADIGDHAVRRMPMSIRRQPGGDSDPLVTLRAWEGEGGHFEVGGQRLAVRLMPYDGTLIVNPADLPALVAAMRSAAELRVVNDSGRPIGSVSLAGATAALRYMDEAQGRIGTVTALTDRGERSASAVPAGAAVPEVRLPADLLNAPFEIDAAALARARRQMGCTVEEVGGPDEWSGVNLDERRLLLLLACGTGAYNLAIVPLIAERRGTAIAFTRAPIDLPESEESNSLTNAEYNHNARVLTAFYRARGLGDCGVRSTYAWDGRQLRLVLREDMPECRGATDFIPTWRARVVRP
jgi:hypothetical protein